MTMWLTRPSWLLLAIGTSLAPSAWALDSAWLSQLILQDTPRHNLTADMLPAMPANAPSTALEYARNVDAKLDIQRHGQWQQDGSIAIWRLRIDSDSASSLSLTLNNMALSPSASLRLFDGEGQLWHGPIAAAELLKRASYWTPLVPGNSLLVELKLPQAERDRARMQIAQIQHGEKAWFNRAKSGSCNIDTACSVADDWQDAVRATARITIGNRRLCSAVLLNNTAQDGAPLLLTANHCGIGESSELSAASVVVYWNFETSQCGGSPDGNLRQFQQGSSLLASGAGADFSLVRLDQIPPDIYRVYYAGWDARPLNPRGGASVHHPSGDEKRISFYSQQAEARTANVEGNRVQTWQVFWRDGITEPGSSGAGLWNSAHRVVGQLSGGNSSCSNPDASDVFGRLDASWQASTEASEQLRTWLDPAATGQLTLDGLDSQNSGLKANADEFVEVPADSQFVLLDVLSNDAGAMPLRLVGANSDQGEVEVQGQNLFYRFADNNDRATVEYQVMNRWGEVDSAQVSLHKPDARVALAQARGGALSLFVLALMVSSLGYRWTSSRRK